MPDNPLFDPSTACPTCGSNVRNGDHGGTQPCPLCEPKDQS